MEEMVWLYFSILAVLIAFAAIGSLVYNNSAKMQQEHLVTSLDELKAQCDFACASASYHSHLTLRAVSLHES
jgi:hypothetical protein